jgi:hypothetical protein
MNDYLSVPNIYYHHLLDNRLPIYIFHEKELFQASVSNALPKDRRREVKCCYAEGRGPWKMPNLHERATCLSRFTVFGSSFRFMSLFALYDSLAGVRVAGFSLLSLKALASAVLWGLSSSFYPFRI